MITTDVGTLLSKWAEARNTAAILDKKIAHYRRIMDDYMVKNNLDKYENDLYRVKKSTQQRNVMTKNKVPKEVWDEYSVPQQVLVLTLTEKISKKNRK